MRGVAAMAAVLLAAAVAPAAQAGQLVEVDLPSEGNVDAAQIRFNGEGHPKQLKANVLLPDGFDPAKRYPVLYLLHGAGESYTTWVRKTKADEVTKGLDAIVVMPDAATGFYVNHYNGGRRGSPGWERYFLDEVIPAIEKRFPIREGRRWHAVAGFSMGGYGSAYLASQRPDYFGSSGPMSGFVAPRRPEIPHVFNAATGQDYEKLYGPADGPYAEGHDPVALARNLKYTRNFVITGNGVPNPAMEPPGSPPSLVTGSIGEADLQLHSYDFTRALRAAGATVTHTNLLGIHDHPYWTDHLRRLLRWDPFKPVQESPPRWTYSTIADRGRAWGVTYRFTEPPPVVQTLEQDGATYAGRGAGTVELCDAAGRGAVAELPFRGVELGRSVALRVLGRRGTRLRVEVSASEPAAVRLGGRVVRRGQATTLREVPVQLGAGQRRTVALRVPRAGGRARLVARHGSCAGGRWTTAAAPLR